MYHHLPKIGAGVLFFCLSLPPSSTAEPFQLDETISDLAVLPPLPPSDVLGLTSVHGDVPTSVLFLNTLDEAVTVWWIDYAGIEVFYNALSAMQSYQQLTFLTHPWLIREEQSGRALVGFVPAAEPGVASIIDLSETPAPVPEPATILFAATGLGAIVARRRYQRKIRVSGRASVIRSFRVPRCVGSNTQSA